MHELITIRTSTFKSRKRAATHECMNEVLVTVMINIMDYSDNIKIIPSYCTEIQRSHQKQDIRIVLLKVA